MAKTSSSSRSSSSKSKSGSKSSSSKRGSGKRELLSPRGDKRFVRRDGQGQFKESDDVGKSLSRDRRTSAKSKAKRGYGDRGDR
jgi:hypothetical protein